MKKATYTTKEIIGIVIVEGIIIAAVLHPTTRGLILDAWEAMKCTAINLRNFF